MTKPQATVVYPESCWLQNKRMTYIAKFKPDHFLARGLAAGFDFVPRAAFLAGAFRGFLTPAGLLPDAALLLAALFFPGFASACACRGQHIIFF